MSKRTKRPEKPRAVPAASSTAVTPTPPRFTASPAPTPKRRWPLVAGVGVALLLGGLAVAYLSGCWPSQQPDVKPSDTPEVKAAPPLYESWQAAYLEGVKIGHGHLVSTQQDREGQKVIRTVRTLDLSIKRYKSVVPVRQKQICEETPEGKVLSLEETLVMGGQKNGPLRGVVNGKTLSLRVPDDPRPRELPFPDGVTGTYHQETYFTRNKPKTGDRFELRSFELMILSAIPIRGKVGETEATDQLVLKKGGGVDREPVRLTRVDLQPGKVRIDKTEVQLPGKTTWLDAKGLAVREAFEMQGAGLITLYHTTKEAALEEGVAPEQLPDLGLRVSIPLLQTIDKPYETSEAVYRVTTTEALGKVFAEDARQSVRERKDKSFELVVKADREPGRGTGEPGKEYLASAPFLESDDPLVVALAREAVGAETEPWDKAKKIEGWVNRNMKLSTATGFPTAKQIARELTGDCRQHAMLMAAMCRAAGVPSRTAIGLVYVRDDGRSPVFGFHVWTEVWVGGKWVALDAVFGKGGVGATHLKMADHSWAETVTLAPLLPIARTLGKLQIEVVRAK